MGKEILANNRRRGASDSGNPGDPSNVGEGGSDNPVEENSDISNSELTPQQGDDNACPVVQTGGPTYIDENGCSIPCPEEIQEGSSIPQGCPQQQQPATYNRKGTEGGVPDEAINLGPDLGEFEKIVNQEVCDDGIDNNKNGLIDKHPVYPHQRRILKYKTDLLQPSGVLQRWC